jgi:exosome complex exonuclease RRP6
MDPTRLTLLLIVPQGRDLKRPKSTTDRLDWSLKRANILKPQNAFEQKTDNFEEGPWRPLLTTKPHAQIPLETSLTTFTNEDGLTQYVQQRSLLRWPLKDVAGDADTRRYKHPYEHEITNLQFPNPVFEPREPIKYLPMDKTKAIWVDTYEGVLEMLEELKKATEIAIDLEHHDFRTYTGLLSLMQISTREKDWIVDTLVPWRHKLEVLNEVFADPSILKVRKFAGDRGAMWTN